MPPVAPAAPVAPLAPVAPVLPVAPVSPLGPSTLLGTNFVPLKISPWPLVGRVVVRSTGMPWIWATTLWFCVPVMSPLKAPTNSQADRAWKAGTRSTSGSMGEPPMTRCSLRPVRPSTEDGMGVIPVLPSTTE